MIDPATRWFEVAEIPNKESITVAEQVDKYWFCYYPRPKKVIHDHGSEFIGPSFQELIKDVFQITTKPVTVKNPQANSVLERIHQVLAICYVHLNSKNEKSTKTIPGWAFLMLLDGQYGQLLIPYYKQAMPGQLVFGHDMVFNIAHKANWKDIQDQKEKLIKYNN